jgi:hypothetical protein
MYSRWRGAKRASSVSCWARRKTSRLYRNLGNGSFSDVTASAGPGFAPARASRGMATGDIDGDGRPEILIVNMNDRPALLKNVGPRQNAIAVTLTGTRSNRCTVEAGGRRQIADVVGRGSYYSQSAFTLYFGVGKAEKIDRIEVRWPSGAKQSWSAIAPNRTLLTAEGSDQFVERVFKLVGQTWAADRPLSSVGLCICPG